MKRSSRSKGERMKYMKMLGLVTLAVTAMMAVIATSASASARVCSTSGTGAACEGTSHGKVYTGALSASLAAGTNAVLTGSITVTCKKSTASGKITNGETGTGNIESVTFTECTAGILGACTASTKASAASPFPATATTDELKTSTNGWLDVSKITAEFTCVGQTCKYEKSASTNEITIDGSDNVTAKLTMNLKLTLEPKQPELCGPEDTTYTWEATYTVTTPGNVIIE
jgi:hypothetical protein